MLLLEILDVSENFLLMFREWSLQYDSSNALWFLWDESSIFHFFFVSNLDKRGNWLKVRFIEIETDVLILGSLKKPPATFTLRS